MTLQEKRGIQRRLHKILLNNSELDVFLNLINNRLDYKGVDITEPLITIYEYFMEPLITIYEYFMERLSFVAGLRVLKKEKKNYRFVFDKKPRVYISGKITGLSEEVYTSNFNCAEQTLLSLGYDVVNPVSYSTDPKWKWKDYMKRDIKLLVGCDYIYMLEGWEDSDGASLEKLIADNLEIKELVLDDNGKVV